ncbi:hypothetical protein [Sagittula sp. SSi028]|uniref:hypothetical protein n=1 Tax=Sagittula sp. SSi028 TaxID=3400636 RepID=UPI003AF933A0
MMITMLALLVLFASALLVLANLRVVVGDTFDALRSCARRSYAAGLMPQRAAFAVLWLLIFTLGLAG